MACLRDFGQVEAVSSVWCSPSAGDASQPDFLNAAVRLKVELSPGEILSDLIPAVEAALHRVRDPDNVNAARTIDVDLSLYDDFVGHVGRHRLPDPDILTRAFVAVPLAEMDSNYRHPVDGQTLGEIAAALLDAGPVLRRDSLNLRLSRQTPESPPDPPL